MRGERLGGGGAGGNRSGEAALPGPGETLVWAAIAAAAPRSGGVDGPQPPPRLPRGECWAGGVGWGRGSLPAPWCSGWGTKAAVGRAATPPPPRGAQRETDSLRDPDINAERRAGRRLAVRALRARRSTCARGCAGTDGAGATLLGTSGEPGGRSPESSHLPEVKLAARSPRPSLPPRSGRP